MPRRKASIRLWQTGLIVFVVVVAMLVLSGSVSAGLQAALADKVSTTEARGASALARRIEPELPVTAESRPRIAEIVLEYRTVYETGVWVYDRRGRLVESAYDTAPSDAALARVRDVAQADAAPHAETDLRPGGWALAARAMSTPAGEHAGVVVLASPVDESLRILDSVRDRIWVTFWVSLVIAGVLGFAFSEIIRRRVGAMLVAADAIAEGDFQLRLPTGLVPDEVQDLALAYNRMAVRLGEAFGVMEESRRQIAAVVESMTEGVVAFDPAGQVRVINPEAARLLGVEENDAIGRAADELTAEPGVREVVHAALAGSSTARIVTLGHYTALLNCTTLLRENGEVDGAVLLLSDVTEQRRIEAAQRRFVADASHEMRTPIAAIKGMLELLADGAVDDPAVRDDFIATMQVEADRLGRLVTDLLTLAQLDAGSLKLSQQPEWVADLLGDVARVMHTLAEQDGVTLAVEPPADDVQVLADRDRVMQVLLSFTDNAIEHSTAGSTVYLRGVLLGDRVRLEVADEGPGIEPEEHARVFERFYRANEPRHGRRGGPSSRGGGTGLGLAIAKEIVEAHGSHIDIRSAPGAGTTFSFEVPVA
ncbi:MAG TPA: ATP-binding protein [Coriobacteriia bacterium]|nr:ATP-binding protein [Coriobacteriia bacterium]